MLWPWKKNAELRRRADQARDAADQARERLERTQAEVVQPLRRAADDNRFAALIRESLLNGR